MDSDGFPIDKLPQEVLIAVFQQLTCQELCSISTVSTSWNDISQLPTIWSSFYLRDFLVNLADEPSRLEGTFKEKYISSHTAIRPFTEKVNAEPTNWSPRFQRGDQHYKLFHSEAAIKDLTEALAMPHVPRNEALMLRALAKRRLKRQAEMIADLDLIVTSQNFLYEAAQLAFNDNLREKAFAYLDIGLSRAPLDPELHLHKGEFYFELKDYEKATECFDRTLEVTGGHPAWRARILLEKGRIQLKLENFAKTVAHLTEAIALSPKESGFFFWRGIARYQATEYAEACADFDAALVLQPDSHHFHGWRATSLMHMRRLPESLAAAKVGVALNSKDQMYLGVTYFVLRQYPQAQQAFNQSILKAPRDANAYLWRTWTHIRMDNFELALKDVNTAVELEKSDITLLSRALDNFYVGNTQAAWNDCEMAYKFKTPPSARTSFWLGVAYLVFERPADAEILFKETEESAKRERGPVMGVCRLTEPARVALVRSKDTKLAKELYLQVLEGQFGDKALAEDFYLTILARLFPSNPIYQEMATWYTQQVHKNYPPISE